MASHFGSDLVDVLLPSDIDPGDAWQIDDGQVWAVRAVNGELDGIIHYIFVGASHLVCLLDDALAHLIEVCVLLAFVYVEHCVWLFLFSYIAMLEYFYPRAPCGVPMASS